MSLPEPPDTDPTSVYRWRDGLYAADLLTAAETGTEETEGTGR